MRAISPLAVTFVLATGLVPAAASEVEVTKAEFGLFSKTSLGTKFHESKKVPLEPGQGFGWRIHLKTQKRTVHYREMFELPAAPKDWWSPAGMQVSGDRKTSVIERDVPVSGGVIQNGWEVAEGDPCGESTIRVYIEGSEAATFHFSIECPAI